MSSQCVVQPAGKGTSLFGDVMFSVILGTSPTPVISRDLDFKSGRMLRRPRPHGQCSRGPKRAV